MQELAAARGSEMEEFATYKTVGYFTLRARSCLLPISNCLSLARSISPPLTLTHNPSLPPSPFSRLLALFSLTRWHHRARALVLSFISTC
jgi:hypothetical protein